MCHFINHVHNCHVIQDWVVLGALDLDEFVDQHLQELVDWERNFKALKARGRDAEKLPNEIKVHFEKENRNIY